MADIDDELDAAVTLPDQADGPETEGQEDEALDAEEIDAGDDDVEVDDLEASDVGEDLATDDDVDEDLDADADIGDETHAEPQTCSLSDDDENDEPLERDPLRTHIGRDYFQRVHPGSLSLTYEEVLARALIVRDGAGSIADENHRTIPTMTRYEYARAQGTRAAQINAGSLPLVDVPEGVIDGLQIAALEIKAKKCPLILRRPLPGGRDEYWHLRDLEIVHGF